MNPLFEQRSGGLLAGLDQSAPDEPGLPLGTGRSEIETLLHLYQGNPERFRGLIAAMMARQQPSQNVSRGKPLTGIDQVLHQQVMDRGLGRQRVFPNPVNQMTTAWPQPLGILSDMPDPGIPISDQMRSVPILNEIGALLDRQR